MKKKATAFVGLTAALSAFGLTVVILSGVYIYTKLWTPFRKLEVEKTLKGTELFVRFESKIPVKTVVEYGTNQTCLLKTRSRSDGELKKEGSIKISYVLPEKKHFVRIVATTQDGKEFKSQFLSVR
mgnify:CR=1 FL=1